MTRISILTFLVLGALIAPRASLAETALQKGVRQYSARQFTEAVNTLTAAAQQEPRNAEVHYNLGNAYVQTGDIVRAAREYELGYALAGNGPVATYCSAALTGIRQRRHNSMATSTYRTMSNGRSVIRCPIGTESHHDGVEKAHSSLSAEEWSVWRVYYDKAFRRLEMKVILSMVPNWESMTGISELYYYVDRNRKLRARVSRSTTDDAVNAALLEVVRNLDGSPLIEFPSTIKAESFNFYHGVDLGEVATALRMSGHTTATSARVMNTNAKLQQTGQTAAQGKLAPSASSTAINASLQNTKVTADVAGKVIGKNNTELKAVQQVLPPDAASQVVKGQVVTEPIHKDVSGQVVTKPVHKEVSGQVVTEPVHKDVSGQVVTEPVQNTPAAQPIESSNNDRSAQATESTKKECSGESTSPAKEKTLSPPTKRP